MNISQGAIGGEGERDGIDVNDDGDAELLLPVVAVSDSVPLLLPVLQQPLQPHNAPQNLQAVAEGAIDASLVNPAPGLEIAVAPLHLMRFPWSWINRHWLAVGVVSFICTAIFNTWMYKSYRAGIWITIIIWFHELGYSQTILRGFNLDPDAIVILPFVGGSAFSLNRGSHALVGAQAAVGGTLFANIGLVLLLLLYWCTGNREWGYCAVQASALLRLHLSPIIPFSGGFMWMASLPTVAFVYSSLFVVSSSFQCLIMFRAFSFVKLYQWALVIPRLRVFVHLWRADYGPVNGITFYVYRHWLSVLMPVIWLSFFSMTFLPERLGLLLNPDIANSPHFP